MRRGCLGAIGIGIVLIGAFSVVAAVVEAATGGDGKTTPGQYVFLTVAFAGMLLGGAYLTWRMFRPRAGVGGVGGTGPAGVGRPQPPSDADRERQVLRFAEQAHGRVTVAEVAAGCDMTMPEARAALDRLVLQDAAIIQVSPGGVVVYAITGFLSDEEKANAKDF